MTKLAQAPSTNLFITVLISVLLHAAVLSIVLRNDRPVHLSSEPVGNVTFQINLSNNKVVSHATPSKLQEAKVTQSQSSKRAKPDTPPNPDSHATAEQTTESVNTSQQPEQTAQHSVYTASNDMMKYLETEFRTRFQYPAMARKRGWQGKVVVGLNVNKAGYIHTVNVKHSSGYSVLDNNAKRTFEQIGNVLPVLSKGNTQSYQFTIPVIYMLTKG